MICYGRASHLKLLAVAEDELLLACQGLLLHDGIKLCCAAAYIFVVCIVIRSAGLCVKSCPG